MVKNILAAVALFVVFAFVFCRRARAYEKPFIVTPPYRAVM